MMKDTYKRVGFGPADILLPKDCDWTKWGIVACDQFTSQPEYWEAAENIVGESISALRLILPEIYLNSDSYHDRIKGIHSSMAEYLENDVFQCFENSMIYIERIQGDGRKKSGLIGMMDMEAYEFTAGSKSLTRATEGTILDRIPPRQAVRQDALVELPHAIMLIDDPENKVIGQLEPNGEKIYDFDLMAGGGHITAWLVPEALHESIADALESIKSEGDEPMLFAVGDGNHSLATAKVCYEELKREIGEEAARKHPARYALAEIVNLYDDSLEFEAIHRVMFDVDPENILAEFKNYYPECEITIETEPVADHSEEISKANVEGIHAIEYVWEKGRGYLKVKTSDTESNLPVGTLQNFIDAYLEKFQGTVDYVHDDIAAEMGARPGCMAFMLPAIRKESFFESIIADGALPRKTFSMGHAEDKRYYIEARKIK